MKFMTKSIAAKLIGSSLLVLGVTLFVSSQMLIKQGRCVLFEQINAQGTFLAESAAAACVEPMLLNDYPVLATYAESMANSRDGINFVRIERKDGTLVAAYPENIEDKVAMLSTSRVYAHTITVNHGDTVLGKVIVGISTRRANTAVKSYIRSLTTRGVISFVTIALLLVIVLKGFVTDPLRKLDRHVQLLASGDLDSPIHLKSHDEIGRLGGALDAMRESLRSSYVAIQIQNEELKDLDRLKDEFLANITHELKTPLNGIIGLGRGVLQGDYGQVNDRLYRPMVMMERSAQRLFELCNQILTFSKQKGSLPTADLETFSLSSRLTKILEQNECQFKQKGLGFSYQGPSDLSIQTDPAVFDHVFMNLVSNAIKFTSSGCVRIHANLTGQQAVAISVQDTGVGIPPEMHEAIFMRFRQGFASENREYEGSGIGLSIVQQATHQMGGKICLESEVNQGAIFTVLLPLGKTAVDEEDVSQWNVSKTLTLSRHHALPSAPQTDIEHPSDSPVSDSKCAEAKGQNQSDAPTVLVVDDDQVSREVTSCFLERHHFHVKQAVNGPECLGLVATEHVDLILLDLMMPIMSGYEVLDRLKAMDASHRPLVIVLSAKNQSNSIVKALKCGAMDYVTKPFDRVELLIRIKNLLDLKHERKDCDVLHCDTENNRPRLSGDLSQDISEAIQNPIQDIITMIELSLAQPTDQVDRGHLHQAKKTAYGLLTVLTDMLDVVRPNLGRRALDCQGQQGEASPRHFTGKVLLAEDLLASQTECKALLQDMGFKVDLAQNGMDAVRMGLCHQYELVIINMMMSETDGYYAASQLRIQGVTTPVIALLAYGEDPAECQRIGCSAHLEKPVVPWELYRLICDLLPVSSQVC